MQHLLLCCVVCIKMNKRFEKKHQLTSGLAKAGMYAPTALSRQN